MSKELKPTFSKKEYLESEIINKLNENIANEVQMRLANRMALGNTSPTKFEQAAGMFKQKIKANNEVIEIYTEWIKEEDAKIAEVK